MYPKEVLAVERFPLVSSLNSAIFHSCLLHMYEGIIFKLLDVLPSEYLSKVPIEQNVRAFRYRSTERTSKANSISYLSTKFT